MHMCYEPVFNYMTAILSFPQDAVLFFPHALQLLSLFASVLFISFFSLLTSAYHSSALLPFVIPLHCSSDICLSPSHYLDIKRGRRGHGKHREESLSSHL